MKSLTSVESLRTIKDEMMQLLALAGPAIVNSSTTMAMTATDQIMVGHLGRNALAAASVGNTWYSLMFYFQLGFGTALDTLASQAFGAGNTTGLWSAVLTAVITGTGAALPMIGGLLVAGPVAQHVFAQPPDIAQQVSAFCARLAPGVLPQIIGLLLLKVLQAQNEMLAPALLGVAGFVVNIGMNLVFIRSYGFLGAPVATTVSRVLYLVGSVAILAHSLYCQRRKRLHISLESPTCKQGPVQQSSSEEEESVACNHSSLENKPLVSQPSSEASGLESLSSPVATGIAAKRQQCQNAAVAWGQVGRQAVQRASLLEYLRLAIPGGFMVAMEAASFDITTVMAGTLGAAQVLFFHTVDAHVALLTVNTFAFVSLPFGIATAATIRVGNLLGANRPQLAATSGWCAVACGGVSMLLCALTTLLLRHKIGPLFIDDAEVAKLVTMIAPLGAALMFFDGIMGTAQGVLRGLGEQGKILCFNVLGFWGVGVSTGAILTFSANWGLRGVWTGIAVGVTATCVLNVLGLLVIDWERSAEVTCSQSCGTPRKVELSPRQWLGGKHGVPGTEGKRTSWLGAAWESVSERSLGMPARQDYSLAGSAHEMKVVVAEPHTAW